MFLFILKAAHKGVLTHQISEWNLIKFLIRVEFDQLHINKNFNKCYLVVLLLWVATNPGMKPDVGMIWYGMFFYNLTKSY